MKAVNFKANLRAALDSRDLTVRELSVATGIAKGTLDAYLGSRTTMPALDVAAKIANALGVSMEYLVSGQERERNIESIKQILVELNDKDAETVLAIAKILKMQTND
jgi:transcriptional regulator with XRE-family HTH domain